ncbi:PREDICTED: stAR-related lipid transfer protein 7, mitochondrial [Propithecus coquereli]|uniref:stAR-related lipid transfer protein 7, mitochondrial n=1 Tax=Propithecus coquereli TaxID=379532 RepID=UPI00063F8946|nr:PREDICTED: stAR-related lipid transfer protein 7, mitochondrial [Propithecus coquereli]
MFPRRPLAAWLAGARGGGLLALLANQCRFVTGLRVRRAQQIAQLYGRLYSESSRRVLLGRLWRRLHGRPGHASVLMAALAGVFVWDEERIQEEELQRWVLQRARSVRWSAFYIFVLDVLGSSWPFLFLQLDTEYRKKWDALVIKLEVIERDVVSGSEVLHWVTHFPYPMYSRDYVYVRRYSVDQENNMMVLVSRAVEHPSVPESPEFVRVRSYESQMVIRPHKSFDENGFDYLLTYSDNPQTVFPRYCVSWMVSSGMPDFLEKLHMATLKAKNMEIKVKDYISAKPLEMSSEAKATAQSSERKNEGSRGPARIEYA